MNRNGLTPLSRHTPAISVRASSKQKKNQKQKNSSISQNIFKLRIDKEKIKKDWNLSTIIMLLNIRRWKILGPKTDSVAEILVHYVYWFFQIWSPVLSVSSESSAAIGTSKRVFRPYSSAKTDRFYVRYWFRPQTNCYCSTFKPSLPEYRHDNRVEFSSYLPPASHGQNFFPSPPANCGVAIYFARITKTYARAQWYRCAITAARINQTEYSINYDFANYSRAVNARVTC